MKNLRLRSVLMLESESVSHSVRLSVYITPQTVACQASLSVEFSRQEHWSGHPLSSPKGSSPSRDQTRSPALQAGSFPSEPPGGPAATQWPLILQRCSFYLFLSRPVSAVLCPAPFQRLQSKLYSFPGLSQLSYTLRHSTEIAEQACACLSILCLATSQNLFISFNNFWWIIYQ